MADAWQCEQPPKQVGLCGASGRNKKHAIKRRRSPVGRCIAAPAPAAAIVSALRARSGRLLWWCGPPPRALSRRPPRPRPRPPPAPPPAAAAPAPARARPPATRCPPSAGCRGSAANGKTAACGSRPKGGAAGPAGSDERMRRVSRQTDKGAARPGLVMGARRGAGGAPAPRAHRDLGKGDGFSELLVLKQRQQQQAVGVPAAGE